MFFGRLISTMKKEPLGGILSKAEVIELYETKERRIKYYGIKVGDKFGCDKNGVPISSNDYGYVSNLVWAYNKGASDV